MGAEAAEKKTADAPAAPAVPKVKKGDRKIDTSNRPETHAANAAKATKDFDEVSATDGAGANKPKMKVKKDDIAKAVRALCQVVKKRNGDATQLFESCSESMQILIGLGKVPEKRKAKPFMIQLPHSLWDENVEVCFISKSPQKEWKELLIKKKPYPGLTKVIGLDKLQRNYKTLEAKKLLAESFDVFVCDEAVAEMMPQALGKIFYKEKNKAPIPVKMYDTHKYIKMAIEGTPFRLPAGPCTSVKIGRANMPEEHLVANAAAVIAAVVKLVHTKHHNYVNSINLQATNCPALPIWRRPETPGGPLDLKKSKSDAASSAASVSGSGQSESEVLDSEVPSDAGETLSTRDTVSEQESQDDTTHSGIDTEAGDGDSEQTLDKADMPLLKGLKKRAKRRNADDGSAAATAEKKAAKEVAQASSTAKKDAPSMPPPAKKAKKA